MSEQEEAPDGETVECWNCGGEGVRHLYDEDPLWYGKNDTETCDICEGKGFYVVPYEDGEGVKDSAAQPAIRIPDPNPL